MACALVSPLRDASLEPDEKFDEVKSNLAIVLDQVDYGATEKFALSADFKTVENPGLYVNDLGSIGLPLSDRDAKELIKVCHRAPFGKGSDTFVDVNVRKTWELNPSQFSLRNSQWQAVVSGLVASAAQGLGCTNYFCTKRGRSSIVIKTDLPSTEKAPGMFGTLVIALPSPHYGGQVVANFGGQVKHLSTEEASEYGYSYLAWYADVEHSVMPITSGFRLVLTYNLIASDAIPLSISAAKSQDIATKVSIILDEWRTLCKEAPHEQSVLAYILDHEYTQASLRPGLLKGRDREKWRILNETCNVHQCHLYLAQLTFSRSGGCDGDDAPYRSRYDHYYDADDVDYHDIIEEYDAGIKLPFVHDENGREVATDFDLHASNVVPVDAFNCKPDSEDYSGYTGNEGVSTTHYYRRACLVVLPSSHYVDFVYGSELRNDPSLEAWVATLKRSDNAEANLERLCSLVLDGAAVNKQSTQTRRRSCTVHKNIVTNQTLETVASASLALAWPAVFSKIASYIQDALSPSIPCELGKVVARDGLSVWQAAIETMYKSICSVSVYLEAVDHMVEGYKMACAAKCVEPSDLPFLDEGVRDNVFTTLDQSGEHDPATLISISFRQGGLALNQKIVPYVKTQTSRGNFIVEFLSLLRRHPHIASETKKQAYSEVLNEFARQFTFDLLQKKEKVSYSWDYSQPPNVDLDKEAFADLLHQSLAFDVKEPVSQILEKIEIGVRNANRHAFETVIFPFMTLTFQKALEDSSGVFSRFFCGVIDVCLHRVIGSQPSKPRNWSVKACRCSCMWCKAVSKFLVDPHSRKMRLERFYPNERSHLTSTLRDTDCDIEVDKSVRPQAMNLTKVFQTWRKDQDACSSRCDKMEKSLKGLADQESMKKLLGNQYARLFNMSDIRLPSDPSDPPSGPMIVRTKEEVEESHRKKSEKPKQSKSQTSTKRPLSETQTLHLGYPRKNAKTTFPQLAKPFPFVDLTEE